MSVKDNLQRVWERIARAAERVGRDPKEIKLVAVIKNVPDDLVFEALAAGVTDLGESRVQEAKIRAARIKAQFPQITYHMIGHLQRNKVGQALELFDIIQSVDSQRLLEEINRRASNQVSVLIEVNTSGEQTKFGAEIDRVEELVRFASSCDKIKVEGLMTVGPLGEDPEKVRSCFRKLRELKDQILAMNFPRISMSCLSMGMTDDFEVAIEEGATMVRIGRAIFREG